MFAFLLAAVLVSAAAGVVVMSVLMPAAAGVMVMSVLVSAAAGVMVMPVLMFMRMFAAMFMLMRMFVLMLMFVFMRMLVLMLAAMRMRMLVFVFAHGEKASVQYNSCSIIQLHGAKKMRDHSRKCSRPMSRIASTCSSASE